MITLGIMEGRGNLVYLILFFLLIFLPDSFCLIGRVVLSLNGTHLFALAFSFLGLRVGMG
jgi:hypothetical protein